MRISSEEAGIIKNCILTLDAHAEIYLHGSRVRDDLKGGDIDLIVISENLKLTDKLTLLTELKSQLGDQKIDLTITSAAKSKTDPFVVHTMKQAIHL